MSRVGKQPVAIPKDVKVAVSGGVCTVSNAQHTLSLSIPQGISVEVTEGAVTVKRGSDEKKIKSLHGTIRILIRNMVQGITAGFKKELEIVGVGYKTQIKGKTLVLNLRFSHPVEFPVPADLKVSTPIPTRIIIEGIDKQRVGEFAATIRRILPPEPYKGKGIRYVGEEVRKKLGKALAK